MNKLLAAVPVLFVFSVAFSSCNQQEDYKQVRAEVVALHDKVMADADMAHGQSLVLDSLLSNPGNADTAKISRLTVEMKGANHEMEEWMEHFEPDVSGKNNASAVDYFKGELLKIKKLDLRYKKVMLNADHLIDSIHLGK